MRIRHFFFFFLFTLSSANLTCRHSQPPYSAQQELETFQLPEGFRIELVASEPEISDPVAMAFDEQGRILVVEMTDYPVDPAPLGRIVLLEDADLDGRFEKRSVFAEGFHFPNGVFPWKGGVLVTCTPDIVYLADSNGDNRADIKKVVLTGFAVTNPQLRMNGLQYGIDNWIYGAYLKTWVPRHFVKEFGDMGTPIRFPDHPEIPGAEIQAKGMDFRFKPDQLKVEPVAGNSQFGNTFDARGNRFTVFNNDHVRHVVIQNSYLSRNPFLGVKSAMQSASDHENAATVYPVTEKPTHIHDSEIGHFTSACGNSVYTGGNFPDAYRNAYFVCEPVHNLVHCDILRPSGPTFIASRAFAERDFLASKDSWFHPVFTTIGPDGALYVVDYYRKFVEHPEYTPPDVTFDLREGHGRGRIYRISHQNARSASAPRLREAPAAQLVRHLSDPNMWWRITAQRLLVERRDLSAVPELKALARTGTSAEARFHALWTLQGLEALDAGSILQALNDTHPAVREQAIRLAEEQLSHSAIEEKLAAMSADPDDRVQFQLACTLGMFPPGKFFEPLRQIAFRHLDNSWFQIAVLASAAGDAGQWLHAVVSDPLFAQAGSERKQEFLGRISSIIGARRAESEIAALLALVHKDVSGAPWWQAPMLQGLAEGLARGSQSKLGLAPALQQQLLVLADAGSAPVRAAALNVLARVDLTRSPALQSAIHKAASVARSSNADLESRVNAVKMVSLDPANTGIPLLAGLLDAKEPIAVQSAAARSLSGMEDAKATAVLLDRWPGFSPSIREIALEGLLRRRSQLPLLLDAVEQGKIDARSLSRAKRTQLMRISDAQIKRRAEALFANLADDRKAVIDRYRPAVRVNGNAERGREVFAKNCSKCHRIGSMGYELGPDLASLSNRNKLDLMTQILDPNASIAPGYEEYLIETKDRASISGVVVKESSTSITLRRAGGEEQTILRTNIADSRPSTVSAMPEKVEDAISIDQMADMLAFLKSLSEKRSVAQLRKSN
ncbi:MAG TPA: PVC-type heme-binding CxxCH protein [Acidobacteriota bacterium]